MRTKNTGIYTGLFGVLTVTYLLLALIPRPDQAVLRQYHLSNNSYRLVLLPIIALLLVIWLASLYGSLRLKSYSSLIRKSADGKAFNFISNGFIVLSLSLPLSSILSSSTNLVARDHKSLLPSLTIISNYISLALMAVAFILIARGAEMLMDLVRHHNTTVSQKSWVLLFIILSCLYSYFIVIQPIHTPLAKRAYYLPDWLLVSTIAMPYLYFWYRGLNAAYCLYQYQKHTGGRLYKSSLIYLAAGTGVVILGSVLTRILTTISARLTALSLTPILIVVYVLLIVIGAGYLLVALGARRLRNIEEA